MSSPNSDNRRVRVLLAGLVGNVLEWYDFAVYGFFAMTIGKLFFPSDNPATSLIASFGAFAAGFLMRPVGAVLFGFIGDRFGRKKALMLSVMLMATPTFLIGVLPTHAQIGTSAAVLMVLLRMIQGVSVGGEYTGSIVFLVEHAPANRRAFFGSFSLIGANAGIILGSAIGALVTSLTNEAQLQAWGWRLPFIAGISIAIVGLFVRHGIPEPPAGESPQSPRLIQAVASNWKHVLQASGLNMMSAVSFYTVFIYLATWLVQQVGETSTKALEINTVSMAALAVVLPIVALLADRFGRKPFLLVGSAGTAIFAYPLLWLMHHHNTTLILTGQIGLAIFLGIFLGVIPVTISELFPKHCRVSAASISYNLPFAIFGGTAPMVAAWLVKTTGNAMSVSWYLMLIAAVAFFVALSVKETKKTML